MDIEDHFKDIELIFKKLQSSGITMKLKNCEWFTDKVKNVGHLIKPRQLEIDEVATAMIHKATIPAA